MSDSVFFSIDDKVSLTFNIRYVRGLAISITVLFNTMDPNRKANILQTTFSDAFP